MLARLLVVGLVATLLSLVSPQTLTDTCGPYASPYPCGAPADNASPGPSSSAIAALKKYSNIVTIYLTANSFDFLFGTYPNANNIQRALSNGLYNPQLTETGYLGNSNATYACLPHDTVGYLTATSKPFNTSSCIPNLPFEISGLIPKNVTWSSDPKHTFYATQYNNNGGLMNGFAWSAGKAGEAALGYYDLTGSYIFQLAMNYTLFDNFFQSVFGGVMINHMWMVAPQVPTWNSTANPVCPTYIYQPYPNVSTSNITNLYPYNFIDGSGLYFPANDNSYFTPDCHVVENVQPFTLGKSPNLRPLTYTHIGDLLDTVGASWTWYYQSWNATKNVSIGTKTSAPISFHENPFTYFQKFSDVNSAYTSSHIKDDDQFFSDLANGFLPNVTWVKPDQSDGFGVTDNNPTIGQQKLQQYMNAIYASRYWQQNKMLVIVTFSDSDGLYDHVPPYIGDTFGPGGRVPTILISPDHAGGKINSNPYETGSILKLLETRFGIQESLFTNSARNISTADLTASFTDSVTYVNGSLDQGPIVTFKAAPVTALIEETYVGCAWDAHSMAATPLMVAVGGEKLESSALIINDVWLSYDGWSTAQPKGQSIMADGTGNVIPRRASSAAYLQNGNLLWIGGKNGTTPVYSSLVSYSTDVGTTWRQATSFTPWGARSDMAVCVMPKTNTVFMAGGVGPAAFGTISGAAAFFSDVWKSTDGIGAVWTQTNIGVGVGFHGGSCVGLYDSAALQSGSTQVYSTLFIVSSYASGNYRSIDNGATFEQLDVPWPEPTNGNGGGVQNARIFMSLAVDYDNVLYVLGGSLGEATQDVWTSADKGTTWKVMSQGNSASDFFFPSWIHASCLTITYTATNHTSSAGAYAKQLTIWAGGQGVVPTSGQPLVFPANVYNSPSLVLNPATVVPVTFATLSYNPNNTLNGPYTNATVLPATSTTNGVSSPAVPSLALLTGPGLRSTQPTSFLPQLTGAACASDIHSTVAASRLAAVGGLTSGAVSNNVYLSTDAFTSSSSLTTSSPSSLPATSNGGLAFLVSGALVYIGGITASGAATSSVYTSTNNGAAWSTVTPTGSVFAARSDASVCAVPNTNTVFVVGGNTASGPSAETWTATLAAGASTVTWTQQSSTGLPAFAASAPCVAFSATTAIVTTPAGTVYKTTNGGSSWTFVSTLPFGFQGPRTKYSLTQDRDGFVYAAGGVSTGDVTFTQGSVYLSRDQGVNWYVLLNSATVQRVSQPLLAAAQGSCLAVVYAPSYNATKQLILYGGNITFTNTATYSVVAYTLTPTSQSFSLIPLTLAGPFLPRQQGGLYVVNANSAITLGSLGAAAPGSLILYGGTLPSQTGVTNDVWYSGATPASGFSRLSLGAFNSESYGPATCSDSRRQILYSLGGDISGGDTAGTNTVYASTDLGQTWTSFAGGFPGRGNPVCVVDSQSRVFVMGGKLDDPNGVAVSNDVWMGTLTSASPVTLSWTQRSAAAPFIPRDGPSSTSYYSSTLGVDVLYFTTGYDYQNAVAQGQDNGVGTNDVWVSTTAGSTWTFLTNAAFPPRYHAKLLSTAGGALLMMPGANAPPTTNGGASQGSSYLRNDMWASLDGGYTWGQCASQLFPLFDSTVAPANYVRGSGREDPVAAIDPVTGFLYTGQGLQRSYTGSAASPQPTDLFRSSISFADTAAVAGSCGLAVPQQVGLAGLPASASLCVIMYGLPGNVDYPWSQATTVTLQYDPTPRSTSSGTAVQVVSASGSRTYTNRFGDSLTSALSLAPQGVEYGNNNLMYLNNALPFDSLGLAWNLSTPVQVPGHGPTVQYRILALYNVSGVVLEEHSSRIDNLGSAFLSTVPGFTNVTIGPANLNALAPNYATCQAPITFTNNLRQPTEGNANNGGLRVFYSYFLSDGATYSVQGNLTMLMSSPFAAVFDQLGNPYQTVIAVSGSRLYTYLPTGQTVLSNITGLSTAAYLYADQRFYPYSLLASAPGVYTLNTAPFFDYDGVEFNVSPAVPIAGGQPGAPGVQYYNSTSVYVESPVSSAFLTDGYFLTAPNVAYQTQTYSFASQ